MTRGVCAVRAKENSFHPKVFAKGLYKIEVGEPGTEQWKVAEIPPSQLMVFNCLTTPLDGGIILADKQTH